MPWYVAQTRYYQAIHGPVYVPSHYQEEEDSEI